MKYYVNYLTREVQLEREDNFYQSTVKVSKISVYIRRNLSDEYYLSISFERPDGKKITAQVKDTFAVGEDQVLIDSGVTYDIHNFTVPREALKQAGTLSFTVYINFISRDSDGNKILDKTGKIVSGINTIVKTTVYPNRDYIVYSDDSASEALHSFVNDMINLQSATGITSMVPKDLTQFGATNISTADLTKCRVYVDENGNPEYITLATLREKIATGTTVKTVDAVPSDAEVGSYFFVEI